MAELQRLIYKRLDAGDRRKLSAKSNRATTGGGARDLRFRKWEDFEEIVRAMFPYEKRKRSSRKDTEGKYVPHQSVFHANRLYYVDAEGQEHEVEVEFWEPTGRRGGEGRLSKVHKLPPLAPDLVPSGEGAVFALIAQDETRRLGATYVSEQNLRNRPGWHPRFRDEVLAALDRTPADETLRGYIDFVSGRSRHFTGHG